MATARERLLQALTSIIGQPFSEAGIAALKRLLNTYRVQVKKGEIIEVIETARNSLAHSIVKIWREKSVLDRKQILKQVSPFRIQLKNGFIRGKVQDFEQSQQPSTEPELTNRGGLTRSQIKDNILAHENAYFTDTNTEQAKIDQNKIAGGPRKKSRHRGHCPKCRAQGVVLARAYEEEDYFSCVYCGYQAYLNDIDSKLDLPIAAEMLGPAFEEPDLDDDE